MIDDDIGFVPEGTADDDLGFVREPSPLETAGRSALSNLAAVPGQVAGGLTDPASLYQKGAPWAPAAGGIIGTAVMPGLGTAAGAGLGEIARQAAGIAYGDPNAPTEPMESAQAAMTQTALAGAGEVTNLARAVPGARPIVQRVIQKAGQALRPAIDLGKNVVASATESLTGVRAANVKALIEKPWLQAKGVRDVFRMKKLGKAVEEAEDAAHNKLHPKTAAMIDANRRGLADDIAARSMEKVALKKPVSPREAIAGVRAIDRTFPTPNQKNSRLLQRYSDTRGKLADVVTASEPDLAQAKTAYHEAKVGVDFLKPFRVTKAGNIAAFQPLVAASTAGNLLEAGKRAITAAPFFSPVIYGTGIAAGSAASQIAAGAITNPTARQALISRYVGTWINEREE